MTTIVETAELSTGVRLPFVRQGDPTGIPVLLLHGITDSWRSYEPVLPLLPADFHAIAVTQRGHGDAERPADGYRDVDFAADAAALLDALGIDRAVIVGHSLGAQIAQRFAVTYPDRVLAVVLIGSFAIPRDNPAIVEVGEMGAGMTDPIDPQLVREFQLSTTTRPLPSGQLDTFVAESLKVPARIWRAAFTEMTNSDVATRLAGITAPTLLLWGDHDEIANRAEQQYQLGTIPDARLIVYPGTGHAVHWEEPDRLTGDLVAFVHQVVAAGHHRR